METKTVVNFTEPKKWVLNEKEVEITKLETVTYQWSPAIKKTRQEIEESLMEKSSWEQIEPNKALNNIIKNVALLFNGAFIESTREQVIAVITDLVGKTMIKTRWIIPVEKFNEIAIILQVTQNIPENKFHIISKIS